MIKPKNGKRPSTFKNKREVLPPRLLKLKRNASLLPRKVPSDIN